MGFSPEVSGAKAQCQATLMSDLKSDLRRLGYIATDLKLGQHPPDDCGSLAANRTRREELFGGIAGAAKYPIGSNGLGT
jgi:hypothetical protein